MSWARLEGEFPDHPKVAVLSDKAFRAHVTGICYATQYRTDGRIPKAVARRWPARATAELVAAGLWHQTPEGYVIHDFLVYQLSRTDDDERKSDLSRVRAEAGRRGAAKRWQGAMPADSNLPSEEMAKPMASAMATEWQADGPNPNPNPRSKPQEQEPSARGADAIGNRDLVFEALCEVEGLDWHTANERELGRIRKARGLAAQSHATAVQIAQAAGRWGEVMGSATRTALGVMSNFQLLLNGPARASDRPPPRDRAAEILHRAAQRGLS